jgi:hypothetical protein
MSTLLLPPDQWAQNEFAAAALEDKRRTKRLVKIGARLAAKPGGTLPQAFPDWAELKAAYRFFNQRGVTFERVLAPHLERTRQSCREPGTYLLIEDTTLLDYSDHPATADLGVIGDGTGRGFELHSALAVRLESWTLAQRPEGALLGLFDQQSCSPRPAPEGETRGQRLRRPRKSQCWTAALTAAGRPPAGSRWIYVADCESDFYEPVQRCQRHGVDFVIRSYQDRRLAEACGSADIVLSTVDAQGRCRGPRLVIDRRDAWREGAQALWLDEAGVRRDTANARRGDRPWVPNSSARQAAPVKAPGA